MAEALLRARLEAAGVDARVHSAGLMAGGAPATDHGVAVMAARHLDTSGHRSRRQSADMVAEADLVLGLAREHTREAVLAVPEAWPRAFTLKELVRRAEALRSRRPGEPLGAWLDALHAGRTYDDLLGDAPADDVADPVGLGRRAYERTVEELDDLVGRLARLAWGASGGTTPAPQPPDEGARSSTVAIPAPGAQAPFWRLWARQRISRIR